MKNTLSHIAMAVSLAVASACPAPAQGHDVSNRCSLTDTELVFRWGCGGFEPVFASGEPAGKWRSFDIPLDNVVDLSERPIVAYALLVPQGPGRDFDTRLTLRSSKGDEFSATAHIIPTLWQAVAFDMGGCPFLDDVAAISVAVRNQGDKPWMKSRFSIDSIVAGRPLDLDFDVPGSEKRLIAGVGTAVSRHGGEARLTFDKGAVAEISTVGSRNAIYNPDLATRNTVAVALTNMSSAKELTLTVNTDSAGVITKTMPLPRHGARQVVNFNLSDIAGAKGRVRSLAFNTPSGKGDLLIDRISFEYEEPIRPNAGAITACTATDRLITVSGAVDPAYLDSAKAVEIRHYPFWQTELPFDSLELLASVPAASHFTVNDIANSRLDGRMSHLSSRFAAALRLADGSTIELGRPFYISNWRDFISNPYSFTNPTAEYRVDSYGAAGDGIANDNAAIQRAIDEAAANGGGQVILSGGKTYLATNLELRRGVSLVIEDGAVLRQSPVFAHYTAYPPEYGHDNVIPGIPWTHCMYTNRPFILAKDTDHVKITGGGTIRMDDVYSENPRWMHYARVCSDRIHIVPIAVCNTSHVEISDIDIIRANNYHTIFYRADSVMIGNVKLHQVACMSGDGFSFGNAVTNVRVGRCVFESNDDGIVLCSSYKDPRGGDWRQRVDSIDASVRHIEVLSSYIDSSRKGAGKAIALIPWGSTNPRQDHNEIDDIEVRDCVLRGGHSVGAWPDNPFDGKPFTNAEPDDYAPVKNLRIYGNEYLSALDLFGVLPSTLLTDCGLEGCRTFKNDTFADRTAYWTTKGDVTAANPGEILLADATIYQGLALEPGRYSLEWRGSGKIRPHVTDVDGKKIKVDGKGAFKIDRKTTVLVGVKGKNAILNSLKINNLNK